MKINRIASGLLLTVALAVVSCGTERSDGGSSAKETEAVGLRCRNLIDPEGVDKASLSVGVSPPMRGMSCRRLGKSRSRRAKSRSKKAGPTYGIPRNSCPIVS